MNSRLRNSLPVLVCVVLLCASSTGPTPTGTVSLYDGRNTLANLELVSGVATFTDSKLGARAHTVFATYWSDDYSGSAVLRG
jgi:hypothetical protein